jgi:hypothetical protein
MLPARGAPIEEDGHKLVAEQMLHVLHESAEDLFHASPSLKWRLAERFWQGQEIRLSADGWCNCSDPARK